MACPAPRQEQGKLKLELQREMFPMIKVLLLGLGRWGANHLRVLHSLAVELFVSDVQPRQLDGARKLAMSI